MDLDNGLFGFGPDPVRAGTLDVRVREGLADSLLEIADAIGGEIQFTVATAAPVIRAVRRGPVPPAMFGLHCHLVEAALCEDTTEAVTCAKALVEASHRPTPRLRPVNLTDRELGPGLAERYRRLVCEDEPDVPMPMAPVDAAERARVERLIAESLTLLRSAAPEVAAELHALVAEIVLVDSRAPAGDAEALVFDGASTFYLWGALFLNATRQVNRVGMAVALVHEAAHSLLFGMTMGAPLVENNAAERFASPLRYDPRPMDGLVHATYVLARMIDCLQRLLRSSALEPAEKLAAAAALARHRADYASGLEGVRASARFTPDGQAIFAAMQAVMETD